MEGNFDTTSYLVSNISLTTVSSTKEDSRILATSHMMYKIGMYGHKHDINGRL